MKINVTLQAFCVRGHTLRVINKDKRTIINQQETYMRVKKLFTLLAFLGIAASASAQEVTFTAIGGSHWSGDTNSFDKLFDNTPKKWGTTTSGGGAWFVFQASESVILSGYTIITGEDTATYPGRNPKGWTISGMNADSTPGKNTEGWNIIHSVSEDPGSGMTTVSNNTTVAKNNESYYFEIPSNTKSYKYYKVDFGGANHGAYDGNDIQISEFIPETKITEVNVSETDEDDNYIVTYHGGSGNTSYKRAVDDDHDTDWLGFTWDGNGIVFDSKSDDTVLKSYAFRTVHDSWQERTPVTWKWYGSNEDTAGKPYATTGNNDWNNVDAAIWHEVASVDRNLSLFEQQTPKARQVYYTNNDTPYRYYMLRIIECDPLGTEDLGGQWGGMFGLSEIEINPECEHTNYTYQIAPSGQTTTVCAKCGKTTCAGSAPTTIAMVDGKASWNLGSERTNKAVSYSRTISSNMGTVCLPYDLTVSGKTDNATYYTLGRYDDVNDVLLFDEVTVTLSARTPAIYVRVGSAETLDLRASSITVPVSSNDNPAVNVARGSGWAMVGTVKSGTASESGNSIYYLKGGGFYRCAENGSIKYKPYRAYITGPASANGVKAFGIADDMEDAINSLTPTLTDGEVVLYDLSGRKVSNIRNGEVYIMNGRKVMFNK